MEDKGDIAKPRARGCYSVLFTPNGPSGHSNFRKARFAGSLFSLFHVWTVVGSAKDIYLEKFGADPLTMTFIWSAVSFWGVFTTFMHGAFQDMQLLARCFPVESWGRRAPWYLTHGIIAAFSSILIYVPDIF